MKIATPFSMRKLMAFVGPIGLLLIVCLVVAIKYIDPAPPNHLVIATGDDQSDLQFYAEAYARLLKKDGVTLEIRSTSGPFENLKLLEDDNSGVDVAFVQDGLGSVKEQADISSLGSLYYEPVWIFYRSAKVLTHFSQLEHRKIAVGRKGHGTQVIAERLLKLSGVDPTDSTLVNIDSIESAKALKEGKVDAAIFMLPADSKLIHDLALQKDLKLMDVEQAEAIARRDAAFDHLVLPRGAIDLNADIPTEPVNLVSPTTTLLVRDDLHPALAYLLLKAATEVHGEPGVFEKRGEFPSNKDDVFPLSEDAVQFFKSGGPFWQRYLPYWLAAWFDRFVLLVIPVLAVVVPLVRMIPRLYNWRLRSRIYQRYGELKFLETQVERDTTVANFEKYRSQLDTIEDRVNTMKMPKNFTEYIYSLRGHIQFVRDRLDKTLGARK